MNQLLSSQPIAVNLSNFIYAGLRFFTGASLALAHGFGKIPPPEGLINGISEDGMPMAPFFAWAAALSEALGGILMALGLFTRPATFFVLCTMLFAGLAHHSADPYNIKEKALMFAVIALFYFINGGGKYSGDSMILKK